MRLVVLDTNVVVSAGIHPGGPSARLLMDEVLDGEVQVVTCPAVVSDYLHLMRRSGFASGDLSLSWLAFLIEEALHLPDPPPRPYPGLDAAIRPFLDLASLSGAWLVTANLNHFPHRVRGDVVVLSPSGYRRHLLRNAAGTDDSPTSGQYED